MAKKRFKEIRLDAGRYYYVYDVDGQETPVEVEGIITVLWDVGPEEIKLGVETLIEEAILEGRFPGGLGLVLNEYYAEPIAKKLGWKSKGD